MVAFYKSIENLEGLKGPAVAQHDEQHTSKKPIEKGPGATIPTQQKELTKVKFDKAVAELIIKTTKFLKESLGNAYDPALPNDADFWEGLKLDTMFERVNSETVYMFVLKLMQGREAWKEATRNADMKDLDVLEEHLTANNLPYTAAHLEQFQTDQVQMHARFQGPTADAVDDFLATVHTLTYTHPEVGNYFAKQYLGETMAGEVEEEYADESDTSDFGMSEIEDVSEVKIDME